MTKLVKLLAVETSGALCSVALLVDGGHQLDQPRPPRRVGHQRDAAPIHVVERNGAGPIAERPDHHIGGFDLGARRLADRAERHARIRRAPADGQHAQDQLARFEPEAGEAIDEAADRADVVGAEIGEAVRMRGLGRGIEGPQRAAVRTTRRHAAQEPRGIRGDRIGKRNREGERPVAMFRIGS